jgi:hypothetical protein
LSARDSWIAVRNEKPSRPIATNRMTIATSGDVSPGVGELLDALVEGEHRPSVNSSSATMKE